MRSHHAGLPAVVHQVWWDDRAVNVLPVERVENGGSTMDAARELHRKGSGRGEEGEWEGRGV